MGDDELTAMLSCHTVILYGSRQERRVIIHRLVMMWLEYPR